MQAKRWDGLIASGITAIVGAGGKTTVLSKLVEYGLLKGQPTAVTTTTKLYRTQVDLWNPYYGDDFNAAEEHCAATVREGRCAAWFRGIEGTKVQSLEVGDIDQLHLMHPSWHIAVEADGAKEKWLKAPKSTEPVIPRLTKRTIGVLNLQVLGRPLSDEYIHNIEEVSALLDRPAGAIITPGMLAKLVADRRGLFQYAAGDRILFCTGYDTVPHRIIDGFLDMLTGTSLHSIYLADGYKASCEIRRTLRWK